MLVVQICRDCAAMRYLPTCWAALCMPTAAKMGRKISWRTRMHGASSETRWSLLHDEEQLSLGWGRAGAAPP